MPDANSWQQYSTGTSQHKRTNTIEDLLSTEKYVSSLYDTTVFKPTNPKVRQAIQHIQDRQNHGKTI